MAQPVTSQLVGETFGRGLDDPARYVLGDGIAAVRLAVEQRSIAVDIETSGLDARRFDIKAVTIGTGELAVVLDPTSAPQRRAIRDALTVARQLVFHNATFDVPPLVHEGLMPFESIDKVHDTLVLARLAEPDERTSKGLAEAGERYLGAGYALAKHALLDAFAATRLSRAEGFVRFGLSSPVYVAYAGFDVVTTARLAGVLPGAVRARMAGHALGRSVDCDTERIMDREQTVNRLLLRLSARGLPVDEAAVHDIEVTLRADVHRIDAHLQGFGIDTSSGREKVKQQTVRWLDEHDHLPPDWPRLQSGAPSCRAGWIERVEHPLGQLLRTRSKALRFIEDYSDKVIGSAQPDEHGTLRIHPQINVLAAVTGRMSFGNPPLQQYPASVRRMFRSQVPITSLDWRQIEPVFLANAASDADVIDAFEAGGDLYQPVADRAGCSRKTAKVVLLAAIYGQGIGALARSLDVDEDEADSIRGDVMGSMPAVDRVVTAIKRVADGVGHIGTMSGRILPVPRDTKGKSRGRFMGYKGVNYFVQGSCYDLLAEALYAIEHAQLSDAVFVAVHDEVVCATEAAADVDRIMQTPPADFVRMARRTPVIRTDRHDLGHSWLPKD